ncbi:MAG: DUF3971 domain-containing protein [Silicimonas sp.]|nr:DUF3971 domain-containing protein [Silicimonas sp.]
MAEDTAQEPKTEIVEVKPNYRPRPVKLTVRKRRFRLVRVLWLTLAGLVFACAMLALSGRSVPVPDMLRASIEERVNAGFAGAPLALGDMRFAISREGAPQVLMRDITLADPSGGGVAQLNSLGAELSLDRLLRGEISASAVALAGAQITVRRRADGSFAFRSDQLTETDTGSLPDILAQIDQVLATPALAALEEIEAGGIVATLEDARSGRIWQASNATAILRRTDTGLSVSIVSDVFNGTDALAGLQISLGLNRVSGGVTLGFQLTGMPSTDIALQSPILAWLSVLDAEISGSVRAEMDIDGGLNSFAGTFEVEEGALKPAEDIPPVPFEAAEAYFTYHPVRQRIDFSQVTFKSDEGELQAAGHAYLSELDGPWPRAFLGQFRAERLGYSGGEIFPAPVSFEDIRADLRLRLDPFTVEIGQVVIDNQGVPVRASGKVEARDGAWRASIDATTPGISAERVLELWPVKVSPITRGWLSKNLKAGRLLNPAAAIRFVSGAKPDLALSFDFDGGAAAFLKTMPPLEALSGRASFFNHDFTLAIEKGGVRNPDGAWISAGGSVFRVADTRPKPSFAQIGIAARGALPSLLELLNNAPLRIMERAGRPTDLARAEALAFAKVTLPLKDGIKAGEVVYDVTAELLDLRSDQLVPGRVLRADRMELAANPDGIRMAGDLTLDGVPLSARWSQNFGAAAENGGLIEGEVTLSPESLAAFDLPLPEGMVGGRGRAAYSLRLPREGAPELSLNSDLAGLSLALPEINWRKGPGALGRLQASAVLGEVPEVTGFSLSAPGLDLAGGFDLTEDGFQGATFDKVVVEDWLDAGLRLTPGARGGLDLALTGGTFDLRRFEGGRGSGRGGGGAQSRIDIALDRVVVSEGIALAPFRGQVTPGRFGLSGEFQGRINGGAPIRGVLSPANGGTAVRLQSNRAAAVLRDAGIAEGARDGTLDVVLTPVAGAGSGTYDGQFLIENLRLTQAPIMAALLDAMSIVGLLDQLNGPGIRFNALDGRFRLTPRRIQILEAAAVGPSMGISADGIYDFDRKSIDMRGVISPVYFLNGIGQIFTRRGEGLFGFNYRVAGAVDRPRVGVNPLSILTPGMFRRIFRSAPPGG